MIISIDGPAGSGKSTVAEELSKKLNFIHFNSGALYRGITAYILEKNLNLEDIKENDLKLSTYFDGKIQKVVVNNIDLTSKLRNNEVSVLTPTVSVQPIIRKIVDDCQREFALSHNVVIEGRDIGSFVFPNAEYKFYLDCAVDERAKRRFNEEVIKNPNVTFEEIKQQIIERDKIDKNKKIAPLCIPKNAKIIDSTSLTIDQVVEEMLKHIKI